MVEADERGAGSAGALLAALLAERDMRERAPDRGRGTPPTGPSDLLELAHLFEEAARARFDPGRMPRRRGSPRARSRRSIAASGSSPSSWGAGAAADGPPRRRRTALLLAMLAAYPDRVARRRAPGSAEVVLAGGGSARLAEASVVRDAPFLVAVDAEERRDRRPPGAGPAPAAAGEALRPGRVGGHAGDAPRPLPGRAPLGGGS